MKKYIITTSSLPVKGKESEYENWYTNTHFPDVLKIQGIKTGKHFSPLQNGEQSAEPYLAIYEIETNDISKIIQTLQSGNYDMRPSDAIDLTSLKMGVYEMTNPN